MGKEKEGRIAIQMNFTSKQQVLGLRSQIFKEYQCVGSETPAVLAGVHESFSQRCVMRMAHQ